MTVDTDQTNFDLNENNELTDDTTNYDETIQKQTQEIAELKDKYLRSLADLDNLRKRCEKEKSDLAKFGLEKLMLAVLPVMDSFDKAFESKDLSNKQAQAVYDGMKLVKDQLDAVLSTFGLKSFDSEGEPFDPMFHQAIQRIESDTVKEETVQDEYIKGYMLSERLLRASVVAVAVPKNS